MYVLTISGKFNPTKHLYFSIPFQQINLDEDLETELHNKSCQTFLKGAQHVYPLHGHQPSVNESNLGNPWDKIRIQNGLTPIQGVCSRPKTELGHPKTLSKIFAFIFFLLAGRYKQCKRLNFKTIPPAGPHKRWKWLSKTNRRSQGRIQRANCDLPKSVAGHGGIHKLQTVIFQNLSRPHGPTTTTNRDVPPKIFRSWKQLSNQ